MTCMYCSRPITPFRGMYVHRDTGFTLCDFGDHRNDNRAAPQREETA